MQCAPTNHFIDRGRLTIMGNDVDAEIIKLDV